MTKLNTAQAPVTDWVSFVTPRILGSGTNPTTTDNNVARWRRVGDSIELNFYFGINTISGGSGSVEINIQDALAGIQIDLNKIKSNSLQGVNAYSTWYDNSANNVYPLETFVASATTLRFQRIDPATRADLAIADLAAGDQFGFRVVLPIVGWSSNVTMGDRAVEEYAWNSNTADSSDTTSFGNGPQGVLFGAFTGTRTKRVRFQTAIQPTDTILIEVQPSPTGPWLPYTAHNDGSYTFLYQNAQGYGMLFDVVNTTDLNVVFYAYSRPAINAAFGAAGAAWQTSYRWRVRKISSGGMVGYPVSARNVLGDTSGTSTPAGNIGEVVNFDFLSPAMPAAGTIVNAFSKTLQPGCWLIHGGVSVSASAGSVAGNDDYIVVSISSTSATENTSNRMAARLPPIVAGAQRGASAHGFVNLSVATTIYVTVRHNFTTLGTASITQDFAPRPQAIRIA